MTANPVAEIDVQAQKQVKEFVRLFFTRPITEEISMRIKSLRVFAHLEIRHGDWVGIEKDMAEVGTGERHAWLETLILHYLMLYVLANDAGRVYPGDATFVLQGTGKDIQWQCEPDVAFVSKENVTPSSGYIYRAPDLAVEIVSPSQSTEELRTKIAEYLSHGTRECWLVIPDEAAIEVYKPSRAVSVYQKADVIRNSDVLPGFSLNVADLFK
jgi:Uma2 family endonuclease